MNVTERICIYPPNSVILVTGSKFAKIPETFNNKLTTSTLDCIAVGCRSEFDGPTVILFQGKDEDIDKISYVETVKIQIEDGSVRLEDINGNLYSKLNTSCSHANIRIVCNDDIEPDEIVIQVQTEDK